jgi:2-polyprenyl-6-methoxyphenol hydroxylase-like FAD-dependent oxidoreductase
VKLKKQFDGNVAFIGDAAHALSPHLSSGTNLAMLDAFELSKAVDELKSMPAAMSRFGKRRKRQINTYYRVSRLITPFFQSAKNLSFGRDVVLRLLIKIPYFRTQIVQMVLGIKKGLFSTLKKEYYHD